MNDLMLLSNSFSPGRRLHSPRRREETVGHQCTDCRFQAPRPLRVFLRHQAQANLGRQGITEAAAKL